MKHPTQRLRSLLIPSALLVTLAGTATARLDEGMWTFDSPPLERLRDGYGFEPTPGWLEHVRLSSVRLNDGGSGSIVSPNGLVLTNHHVGFNAIQKLSTEEHDFIANGFYAPTMEDELACTDLEINVLVSIEDVTARVLGAVADGADEKEAREQREAEIARIEQAENESTGLRCNVIKLYRGGVYSLYRFKKYTEVRLVFAPEMQAAFFGGDPDNFNFPRYALDMALFRVYEDGQPVETPHYLRWNSVGAREGDLVFVSGNPGSTGRLNTLAQMEYLRDDSYPRIFDYLLDTHEVLSAYSAQSEEQNRRAKQALFGNENSIKAIGGYLDSLRDQDALVGKANREGELRAFVANDPELAAELGDPWAQIERAVAIKREIGHRDFYSTIRGSKLFTFARHIVRMTAELEKPNDERLPEYRDSNLESLELSLYSEAPIYADYEEVRIAASLAMALDELGPDDPFVQAAIAVARPVEAATSLSQETSLADVGARRALVTGGRAAVESSDDPMIQLALRIDPIQRELRSIKEDGVDSVESSAGEKIARARFAAWGTSVYPDATFSLRLSYGVVRGFEYDGFRVPYKTTVAGLFERSASFEGQAPWNLAPAWEERKGDLDWSTPFNFVCTADIIGGNSGSPVIDREGKLVGLIFDGNVYSLGNRFVYDDTLARSVAVHTAAMIEAMENVYGADRIVEEIRSAAR